VKGSYQPREVMDLYRRGLVDMCMKGMTAQGLNFAQNRMQIRLIDLVFFIAFKDSANILDLFLQTKHQQQVKYTK
jgi:hypothetical protein